MKNKIAGILLICVASLFLVLVGVTPYLHNHSFDENEPADCLAGFINSKLIPYMVSVLLLTIGLNASFTAYYPLDARLPAWMAPLSNRTRAPPVSFL